MELRKSINQKHTSSFRFSSGNGGAKPFLKWAGGKSQLLEELISRLPPDIYRGKLTRYIEPFIGGGALFFYVAQEFNLNEYVISDINRDLILAYRTIQEDVEQLIDKLKRIENKYLKFDWEQRKDYFYKTRSYFNNCIIDYENFSNAWIERTAHLIFLNRTCFNGLFRVNSKGEFNVPFGRYVNPEICSTDNLRHIHSILKRTTICCGDFENCREYIDSRTFVYFDPPYRPISKTSNFTSYCQSNFNETDQIRLAEFFEQLDKLGVKLMLSNSDPTKEDSTDNFFESQYSSFNIGRVQAKRIINCNANKRGVVSEVLITNY